ncbi:trehalose-phosphatase [candidate division KSB1 bacterium]|nr:trehalose-phosphatase [candidate division KSB1 bacterium]
MLIPENKNFTDDKLEKFFQTLHRSKHSILMLDYDGTLAPFRKERDQAIPYKGIREVLKKLLQLEKTRIIIISGRSINDLIPLIGLKQLPEIWGSHGIERRKSTGKYTMMDLPEAALNGIRGANLYLINNGLAKYSEEKPGCLAIHWRGLKYSEIEQIQNQVLPNWTVIADEANLLLKNFDGGLELRVPGMNKGDVVKILLDESGNETLAAYLGDDLTDEDAFRAIKGKGLGILIRKVYRSTEAEVWLKPPKELRMFLDKWYNILYSNR